MGRIWTRPRTIAAAQLLRPERTPDYPIIANPNDPLYDRCVGWWPMSKSANSGQTTGILPDICGNYDLLQQFGSWRHDQKAFYCNTTGYFIDSPYKFQLPANGAQSKERTISAWIKLNSSAADGAIAGHLRHLFWTSYGLGLKYESGAVAAMGENADSNATLTFALTDTTKWHHVVGVFATGGQLWVDGILRASGALDDGWSYHFALGVARGGGAEALRIFDGYLRNVQYWERRLNDREIKRLYYEPYGHAKAANDRVFLYPVVFGTQTINADFVDSATTIYEPSVTGGAATISADYFDSTTTIYDADVKGLTTISADYFDSATTVPQPTVSGLATVAADYVDSATTVYQPTLTGGVTSVFADFVASSTIIYEPAVSGGAATIAADYVDSATTIYQPIISAFSVISADYFDSTTAIYDPVLTPGSATIAADFFDSTTALYQPAVTFPGLGQSISADYFDSVSDIYQPTTSMVGGWYAVQDESTTWTDLTDTSTAWTEI